MAEDRSLSDPYRGAMRPGRGRAPGTSRAVGNRVYRTNAATGNLELSSEFEANQPDSAQTGTPTERTSPLSNVRAEPTIPQVQAPSMAQQVGQVAGVTAVSEGVKKGVNTGIAAARTAMDNHSLAAGTAGKPITAPGFDPDALRQEALDNAKYVGDDALGGADTGGNSLEGIPDDIGNDFPVDAGGGAADGADAASGAYDGFDTGGVENFEYAGDAASAADAAGAAIPWVGGAVHLAQGDPRGAAGSVVGGTLGGYFGPVGAAVGSYIGGQVAAPIANEFWDFNEGIGGEDFSRVMDPFAALTETEDIGQNAENLIKAPIGLENDIRNSAGGAVEDLGQSVDHHIGGDVGEFVGDAVSSIGKAASKCYITEAVTSAGGEDNGPELETLRWFRDNVLQRTPEGQQLIAEYDQAAPAIVQAIQQRPDAMQLMQGILSGYIQPATEAVRAGQFDEALRIYAEMSAEVADLAIDTTEDPALEQIIEEFAQEAAEVTHDGEMAGLATETGMEMQHPLQEETQPRSPLGRVFVGG